MIQELDIYQLQCIPYPTCNLYICLTCLQTPAWVIMGQDNSMSIGLDCILQYYPGIYDTA